MRIFLALLMLMVTCSISHAITSDAQLTTGTLRITAIQVDEMVQGFVIAISADKGGKYWIKAESLSGNDPTTTTEPQTANGLPLYFQIGKRSPAPIAHRLTLYADFGSTSTGNANIVIIDGKRNPKTLDALILALGSIDRATSFVKRLQTRWDNRSVDNATQKDMLQDLRKVSINLYLSDRLTEAQKKLDAAKIEAEQADNENKTEVVPLK